MWKQFLRFFLIIVLTAGLIVYFSYKEIKKEYIENLQITLENYAQLIERSLKDYVVENKTEDLNQFAKQLGDELGIRCTIIKKDGKVLGDSDEEPRKMENHSDRPEIIQAFNTGIGTHVRKSETLNKEMIYVAVPLVYQDKILGVIRTSSFIEDIQQNIKDFTKNIIGVTILIILLALIFSIITTESYTKPVRDIAKTANRIKQGNFKARLYIKRSDELGFLANTINEMARELEDNFLSLKEERERLKTIISSMVEALLVIDKDGKIIMANENFSKIFDKKVDDITGKQYWEFIHETDFIKLVNEILDGNQFKTKEIKIGEKCYLTSCSLISGIPETRIIIVMHDISELKRLEEVKTDFVANVAHELKTPLTAIKGFSETLENEVDENHKKFIQIIRANTDRLINIVSDLLALSNLEHRHKKIDRKKFNLEKLIDNSLLIEHKKLDQKNIDVTFEFDECIPKFQGDPFLIEQMMINLIDNAITYTEENGKICIDVSDEENSIVIEIEDNGVGIPEDQLPRIFERFYVVDKSRSRKLGGTGLGLSIVKHIVLSHEGEVRVESQLGEGTKFIITLPRA